MTRGFMDGAPRPDCDWLEARAAGLPMLGELCWLAKPNWRLLGRLAGPPLGMYPEAPAEVMVTEGFREWSPWEAGGAVGAPLTMVTPDAAEAACWGGWFCMGLPLTGDTEVDFPCCTGPPTVTGAAVESVADCFVAALA